MRSRAWSNFQTSRREIRDLLDLAMAADGTVARGQRIANQELLLRSATVVLVGALHNYVETLLEEWGDLLGPDFKSLSTISRKYVVLQIQLRLTQALGEYPEESLGDPGAQEKFANAVAESCEWLNIPKSLAASASRPRLEGFFRQWGANAVDRALTQFRDDGTKFFTWLSKQNTGYSDYFIRLNSVIEMRNEVAHGLLKGRLTIEDFRRHRSTISQLVRKSEQFVSPGLEAARQAFEDAKV